MKAPKNSRADILLDLVQNGALSGVEISE
jgi:hypothetical protein